jgi:hypothetical protein
MQAIATTLSTLDLGAPQQHQNLALFPLLDRSAGESAYLLLDEVMEAGQAQVTEISEGGSVPEVSFTNSAQRPVLLVDGEELVGAKQNRVLNLTILVAAGRKVRIPVSCVEAGRWQYRSRDFSAARHKLYARARAMKMAQVSKSMRDRGERRSDQGAIWNDISEKMVRMRAPSPTASMEDIYETRAGDLDGYVNAFTAQPEQRGAVFAINGRVVGAELFDSPATFAKYLRKLLSSYAMDAIDVDARAQGLPTQAAVLDFLKEMQAARQEHFPAVGEGQDLRLTGERLAGGALVTGDTVVHLAAFRVERAQAAGRFD